MIFLDCIADGVHQMRFTEAWWAVDKERIVVAAWKFSYILRRTKWNAVRVACYVIIETVRWIKVS